MRRVPFVIKFAASSAIAYFMCNKLWNNNIYEAELYEVALRYRDRYDKNFMPIVSNTQPSQFSENGSSGSGGSPTAETNKNL